MLERYILTGDGEEYVDVDCVKEVLGIKEDEDILLEIKKLKEDKDLLEELHANHIDQLKEYAELGLELGIGSGDAESIKDYIASLKKEQDQLKEKYDKMKKRANASYGVSCGYSGDKAPAFLCNVISYSWEFSPINACTLGGGPSYRVRDDSIRVELSLTPTAKYKGTFDLEDLKKYIQNYGREKKLGIIESVDYQNAKAARAELAYLYKQVLGKERLDADLSPHGIMKAIHDEYKRVRDSQFAFSQCLRSVYMEIHEGTGYDINDIYAAPDKLADEIVTRYNSARMSSRLETLSEIDEYIDELCDKYTIVQPDRRETTRERLDYIFGVLAEYRDLANNNFNKAEGFRKEKRAVEYGASCGDNVLPCYRDTCNNPKAIRERDAAKDSLAELRAKVREIYRSVVDDEWDEHLGYTSALNDINEEYKRVVHNFEERTADWSKAQQELDRYRLAVGSLLDIPKETRDDINAIERSFTFSKKKYESLKEFRDNVCEIFDIPSSMADDQKQVLKEIHDFAERYYELRDFRADICGALDIEGMLGTPQQNDKYILEQVKKLKESAGHDKLFRDSVCDALDTTTAVSDSYLFKKIEKLKLDHKEAKEKYSRYCLAVGSLCNIPDEHREDISWIEDAFNHTKKDYLKWQTTADRLARLRSDICTALCLGHEDCDGNIIGRIHMMQDCHEKLCKDYTELRKAIWDAMDRKPETLPGETARLVGEVAELAHGEKLLIEFRDAVAKAIGITYPTTNNFILKRVSDIYKERGEAHDLAMELDRKCIDLTAKNSDLQQKFQFQSGLRQQWHARYESEHERANGVQKALDREREKCRVKDISLETAKKQYEKVCGNLETAECALNGMKSKVRGLQDEKTKVITALGQDVWDECLK